jgi:hypothetical protein
MHILFSQAMECLSSEFYILICAPNWHPVPVRYHFLGIHFLFYACGLFQRVNGFIWIQGEKFHNPANAG